MKMSAKEKNFRQRAARHGLTVTRRGKLFILREGKRVISCADASAHGDA
jgi:hypothetical protein